jgi:hypothetical protein
LVAIVAVVGSIAMALCKTAAILQIKRSTGEVSASAGGAGVGGGRSGVRCAVFDKCLRSRKEYYWDSRRCWG